MQSDVIMTFKVVQDHLCQYQSKARNLTSYYRVTFLLVIAAWYCIAEDEVGLHHTDSQEGRHGLG